MNPDQYYIIEAQTSKKVKSVSLIREEIIAETEYKLWAVINEDDTTLEVIQFHRGNEAGQVTAIATEEIKSQIFDNGKTS